ncbi:hypothetical protein IFM89_023115 [Coptis chinensis]|uniref:Uncharacterized protein n=1 Tax=Coptis chinensis TaxID=261450 RepID=A0A835HXB3_9MAGN|nr:hypothetical protein IFM89_023115 [Coptis chinensis]
MDSSKPVARRTRAQFNLFLKEECERRKKSREGGGDNKAESSVRKSSQQFNNGKNKDGAVDFENSKKKKVNVVKKVKKVKYLTDDSDDVEEGDTSDEEEEYSDDDDDDDDDEGGEKSSDDSLSDKDCKLVKKSSTKSDVGVEREEEEEEEDDDDEDLGVPKDGIEVIAIPSSSSSDDGEEEKDKLYFSGDEEEVSKVVSEDGDEANEADTENAEESSDGDEENEADTENAEVSSDGDEENEADTENAEVSSDGDEENEADTENAEVSSDGDEENEADTENAEVSSDGDSDESNDKNFKRRKVGGLDEAHCCASVEEESSEDSEDDTEVVKDCVIEDIDEGIENRLKRRKVDGLDVLIPAKTGSKVSSTSNGRDCVARRTRSTYSSHSSFNKKDGTFSHPITLDEMDTDRSSGNDSVEDNGDAELNVVKPAKKDVKLRKTSNEKSSVARRTRSHLSSMNQKGGSGDQEEILKKKEGVFGGAAKRKRVHAPKDSPLFKLFVSTIWEKGGSLQQQEAVSPVDVDKPRPVKFNFGVETPKPVEKSDDEKYRDMLWVEFDFALRSCELGSFVSSQVDSEYPNKPNVETDPSALCSQGKHDYILDEEIGIRCRFCSFVQTEIKYILPPLEKRRSERSTTKNSSDVGEFSLWEEFDLQGAGGHSHFSHFHGKRTVWDIVPQIRETLYPHQQEGFEFLWKNIAGGIEIDKLKNFAPSDGTGGCVISHAPGTGKTRLTIVFLQSYMKMFEECRPMIIAPCSMLLTWEEEFKKWNAKIPFHNLNSRDFSGKEDEMARQLIHGKTQQIKWNRMVKLLSWSKGKSILGISYRLFETLVGRRNIRDEDKKKRREILRADEVEEMSRILLGKPSLLVLDEGHTPRNKRTRIWKALEKSKTERRIILSGTPFQNNFKELYNTLWLVKPKFADSFSSSRTQKISRSTSGNARKDAREKWASLTSSIGKDDNCRLLKQIRTVISPFVHVHRGSVLKENLPGLRDCVIVLKPPPLQMKLLKQVGDIKNQVELEHALCLVSVHPSLWIKCSRSRDDISFIHKITSNKFKLDPYEGVKTSFLLELIRLSEAKQEKVLVFSQYLQPFSLIKEQLKDLFNWTEGEEVLQMEGKCKAKLRQSIINNFNDPSSKVKVLLASTKACREGINLVGASRIVLLDVVWNPSVERQAISRAYRIGQKKVVFAYHLITSGTMEGDKYRRQDLKDRLSELVFASTHSHDDKLNGSLTTEDDAILQEMVANTKLKHMFKEIIYQPKESNLVDTYF